MKSYLSKIIVFLALVLLPLGCAHAQETKTGDSIYIPKDEIVSGNLYAAGNVITVDGNISGDLIAIAQMITVNGRVDGDIIAAGQNLTVNGEVGGNIRVAGTTITLNGPVVRNVNALGSNIVLGSTSKIGWDVYAAGINLESRGDIEGGLSGHVSKALISGKVAKNINLTLADDKLDEGLVISPEAVIGGDIIYTSTKQASISEKASLGGVLKQIVPEKNKNNNFMTFGIWSKLYSIFAALAMGLILITLLKKITPKILSKIEAQPLKVVLPGLILLFALPPIALVLTFTLIGIPLAIILMLAWLVAIYVAKIFAAILLGQIIIKTLNKNHRPKLIWSLILGVIICWLLFAIPFVGWIISLIAIWLGLGGIYAYASNQYRNL